MVAKRLAKGVCMLLRIRCQAVASWCHAYPLPGCVAIALERVIILDNSTQFMKNYKFCFLVNNTKASFVKLTPKQQLLIHSSKNFPFFNHQA